MNHVIEKATVKLMLGSPFISNILLSSNVVESNTVPTAGTDGETIWFNPKFIDSLPTKDTQIKLRWTMAIMAHEVYHIAFLHPFRRKDRDPMIWNIACDAVINAHLRSEGFEFPTGCVDIEGSENKSAEEVYDDLMKNAKKVKAIMSAGGLGPIGQDIKEPKPGDGNAEDKGSSLEEKEMRASIKVQKALDIAKACGKLPGNLARTIGEAMEAKIPWQQLLREAVTTIMKKDDYTWARMNRRHIYTNTYLPGMEGTQCGPIGLIFDTSGSIGERELSAFLSELNSIIEEVNPEEIHVIACDADVAHYEKLDDSERTLEADEFTKMMKGGGGTAFSPPFKYMNKKGINVDMAIYFTDLCGSDFGNEPTYPVLWVSTSSQEAPWGKVIKLDL